MTEELNIRDNQKKKEQLLAGEPTSSRNDELDLGEASWTVPEKNPRDKFTNAEIKDKEEFPPFPPMPGYDESDEEESKPSKSSIDIVRLAHGILNRKKLVLIIAMTIAALFAGMAFFTMHNTWKARSILMKRDHGDLFSIGQFSQLYKPQQYNMKTLLSTVTLPSVLDDAIHRSGVQLSADEFIKHITVVLDDKESSVIGVSVEWDGAEKAAKIANDLVDAFLASNKNMKRKDAEDVVSHYRSQLDYAIGEQEKVEADLLAFRNSSNAVNVDFQTKTTLQKLDDLEEKLQDEKAALHAMEESKERQKQAVAEVPELTVQSVYYRHQLEIKLADLQIQLEQDTGRYTENNPKIIDLNEQISHLKEQISQHKAGEMPPADSTTYAANPLLQELRLRLQKLLDDIKTSAARVDALQNLVDKESERLTSLNANSKRYYQLISKEESLHRLEDGLRNRIEEARVIMLKNESDFDVIERAVIPEKPKSSGRKLVLIAGVILGTLAGLLTALVLEFLDPSIRTRREMLGMTDAELVFEFQHIPDTAQDVIDILHPREPIALLFRRIINEMSALNTKDTSQSIAMISAERGAGKSLITCNMAQALAMKEESVLIVDADLSAEVGARPASLFSLESEKAGLLQFLDGTASQLFNVIHQTETPAVSLVPASDTSPLTADSIMLLGNKRMCSLISELRNHARFVLYDLPPLANHETSFETVANIGVALLVVRSGHSKKSEIKVLLDRLKVAKIELLAVVISDVPESLMSAPPQFKSEKSTGLFGHKVSHV